jgi:hypothetical protein
MRDRGGCGGSGARDERGAEWLARASRRPEAGGAPGPREVAAGGAGPYDGPVGDGARYECRICRASYEDAASARACADAGYPAAGSVPVGAPVWVRVRGGYWERRVMAGYCRNKTGNSVGAHEWAAELDAPVPGADGDPDDTVPLSRLRTKPPVDGEPVGEGDPYR